MLSSQGVAKLSVRAVAQAAGIPPAQVQYYYRSKRDLIRAGFQYSSDQFLAAVAESQPQTFIELILQWLPLDEGRERRARVWLAFTEMAVRDEQLAGEAARIDAELRQWFMGIGVPESHAAQLLALIDGTTAHCLVLPFPHRQAFVEGTVLAFMDNNDLNLTLRH